MASIQSGLWQCQSLLLYMQLLATFLVHINYDKKKNRPLLKTSNYLFNILIIMQLEVVFQMNKKIIHVYFLLLGCALRYNLVSFLYLLFLLGLPLIPAPSAVTVKGNMLHATGAACCNVFIKFIDIVPQREDLYSIYQHLLVDL